MGVSFNHLSLPQEKNANQPQSHGDHGGASILRALGVSVVEKMTVDHQDTEITEDNRTKSSPCSRCLCGGEKHQSTTEARRIRRRRNLRALGVSVVGFMDRS